VGARSGFDQPPVPSWQASSYHAVVSVLSAPETEIAAQVSVMLEEGN